MKKETLWMTAIVIVVLAIGWRGCGCDDVDERLVNADVAVSLPADVTPTDAPADAVDAPQDATKT